MKVVKKNIYNKGGKVKETPEEKKKRLEAEAAAKKKENEAKKKEKSKIKKSKETQVAVQKDNTREQNKNLNAAREEYRESKRSEDSKIVLDEAKAIKATGDWFQGAVAGDVAPRTRKKIRQSFRVNKKK